MAGVFISYRREDTAEMCDRLDEALAGYFGRANVFKDKSAMVSGRDFADQIQQAIAHSNLMLVLIGPRWMSLTGASGVKRIQEPEDYVRREIELARQNGVSVIPVLVNLAPMPGAADLPPSIAFLSTIDAAPLRVDPDYPWDLQRLIEKILVLAPQLTPRFDPAAALAQARSGAVPAGWRVWRPSAGSAVRRAFAWLFTGALATFVVLFFVTVLTLMGGMGGSSESSVSNSASTGLLFALSAAVIVGVIGGVIGLITGVSNASGGYLVLTPDGVAQAIGASHDTADFAEVENISTSVEVRTSGGGQNAPATTWTRTRLAFLMRDGSQRLWGVRKEFGAINAIGQAIIAAHSRYTQTHKGLGVPNLPHYLPTPPQAALAVSSAAPASAAPWPSTPPSPYASGAPAPAKSATRRRPVGLFFLIIVEGIAGGLALALAYSSAGQGAVGTFTVFAIAVLAGGVTTWRARAFLPSLAVGVIAGVVFSAGADWFALQAATYGVPQPSLLFQDAIVVLASCALAALGAGIALLFGRLARRG